MHSGLASFDEAHNLLLSHEIMLEYQVSHMDSYAFFQENMVNMSNLNFKSSSQGSKPNNLSLSKHGWNMLDFLK